MLELSEESWVGANLEIVQRALDVFLDTGEWPAPSALRRHFAQLGRDADIERIMRERPSRPGELRMLHEQSFTLHIRHLRYVPSASRLLAVCIAATRRAVEVYTGDAPEPKVSSTDELLVEAAEGDQRLLVRSGTLLQSEHPGPLSGGGYGPDHWEYWVNEHTILQFRDVTSADDFVARQDAIVAADPNVQAVQRSRALDSVLVQPLVFVIMPFQPAWSRTVYEMIKRAVAALSVTPEPLVQRSDEITTPGRITDQIVSGIQLARVVVADITGLNANVMWELGYAHALGKPTVILNQQIGESPFDLVDHRQVGYAEHPTSDDESRIIEFLRSALDSRA